MVPGYHEVRELGVGGGGRVVLATYTPTGAYVALKYLNATLKGDDGFLARFREEARIMVELRDPNVVRFYEYYEDVLDAAIVMELVDGVALRRVLSDHGTTSPEAALAVLKGSLAGLASAHSAGIAHRDHKPENVLIQADGTGKLTDFGIAAPTGEAGVPAGTPHYMAPERWAGGPADSASDIYAATCVFFECLTGRAPYRADHPATLMHRHRTAPIPVEAVPSSVRKLVARGMAKDPADRPPTAHAFIAELEAAALSAYGPEWEQRGRRHLAELATLLALTFPLAKPAPRAGTPVARSVIGRMGGIRRPRPGPRVMAAAAVITVAVTAGLVSAGRASDRLSAGTVFTPGPESSAAESEPSMRKPAGKGTAPSPPEPVTTSGPSRHATADQVTPSARGASPNRSTNRPARPTPDPSRTPPAAPSPTLPAPFPVTPPPAHAVSGLTIAGIDASGATVALRASTTAGVVLTVGFAEGQDRERLTEAPPRSFTLAGADAYSPTVPHAFTVPGCGQTLYRRVTVSTSPQATGGPRSRTVEVKGGPCPSPSVKSVDITSFDGTTVRFRVRTGGPSAVTVKLGFTQQVIGGEGEQTGGTQVLELSGLTEYVREAVVRFTMPPGCSGYGGYVHRVVTLTTVPGSGAHSREMRLPLPACTPDPTPSGAEQPADGEPAPDGSTGGDTLVSEPSVR
ncbi:protein kinase domain-containing protein [Streptosporangium sp. CA-135522]|uniref:protein kinase domain-containing protein n=1 Tax=Streptosporangium sp. CA-135522 TaxID=3240072 RepID=UPI003D914A0E